jgi:hypothetical protein
VAEWTPFQTHYFSENLVTPGIEPGPMDVARNSNHSTTEVANDTPLTSLNQKHVTVLEQNMSSVEFHEDWI